MIPQGNISLKIQKTKNGKSFNKFDKLNIHRKNYQNNINLKKTKCFMQDQKFLYEKNVTIKNYKNINNNLSNKGRPKDNIKITSIKNKNCDNNNERLDLGNPKDSHAFSKIYDIHLKENKKFSNIAIDKNKTVINYKPIKTKNNFNNIEEYINKQNQSNINNNYIQDETNENLIKELEGHKNNGNKNDYINYGYNNNLKTNNDIQIITNNRKLNENIFEKIYYPMQEEIFPDKESNNQMNTLKIILLIIIIYHLT